MHQRYKLLSDSSIIDPEGKLAFISVTRFINEIALGDSCFLCGAKRNEKRFNDEHIIPNWVLKKYHIQNKKIRLPNDKEIQYSQYKVPCCYECNKLLGNIIEKPLSKVISEGYDSFKNYLKTEGPSLLFKWLCLIFLKVHLKDSLYRFILSDPLNKISDLYDWKSLHHIHCVVRSLYTNCKIERNVLGSMLVFRVKNEIDVEPFDYGDNYLGKGILIRLGEIGVIAILNDSIITRYLYRDKIKKLNELKQLQYREVLSILSYMNYSLKNRPAYFTEVDQENGLTIKAIIPRKIEFEKNTFFSYGDFLFSGCKKILPSEINPDILEGIKKGNWTFLFDKNREFIND
ncbi:MAG TPA: hypothetical protein GX708_18775 [Gallicola sp.]|nr:hypothetical protein [Gallicola sp.]